MAGERCARAWAWPGPPTSSGTLNHPDVWLLLVGERGGTPGQWERWFAATAREQLLGPGA
jgi:hypothetical protein